MPCVLDLRLTDLLQGFASLIVKIIFIQIYRRRIRFRNCTRQSAAMVFLRLPLMEAKRKSGFAKYIWKKTRVSSIIVLTAH